MSEIRTSLDLLERTRPAIPSALAYLRRRLSLNLGGFNSPRRQFGHSLASAPNLPSGLAKGFEYSDTWFGESFTAWTKWYVGVGF